MARFVHPEGLDLFDQVDPIDMNLIDDCVHCGFCLPACPTYELFENEMDSPRGRIYLMGELARGAAVTEAATMHLDRCLGCFACMTACPSGVHYDELLETTRAQLERHGARSSSQRATRSAVFALFPYPRRLRPMAWLLATLEAQKISEKLRSSSVVRTLPGVLGAAMRLAPRMRRRIAVPARSDAVGAARDTVGLLTGCVQGAFFSNVNAATISVLCAEGYNVVAPENQGCCGALSAHAGRLDEARDFARALIDSFGATGMDTIVVNSAGCGSAMKNYGHLLADDPNYCDAASRIAAGTRDVTEVLVASTSRATRHPLNVTIAYHDACHLCHGQDIRLEPRELLGAIPGLEIRELGDNEACCGSAGIYNLVEADAARRIGAKKAASVRASGAELLASGNPGCNLQIAAALRSEGAEIPVRHTIEILAASLANDPDALTMTTPRRERRPILSLVGQILSGNKAKR